MRESKIENRANDFAEINGILVMKLAGPNQKGQPDRLYLKDGKMLFIEYKAPGKPLKPLQEQWQKDLREQGFICEATDNAGVAIDIIEKHLL